MVEDDSRSVNTRNEFCLPFVSLHRHFYVSIKLIINAEYPYKDYKKSASSAQKSR